jgi:hypothetical protein
MTNSTAGHGFLIRHEVMFPGNLNTMRLRELTIYTMLVALAAVSVACAPGRGSVGRTASGADGPSAVFADAPARGSDPAPEEEQVKKAFLKVVVARGERETQLDNRIREINAVTSIHDLQAWARRLVDAVEVHGLEHRESADRKWLTKEEVFEPLRSLGDPIGAAVIPRFTGQSRVEIIWRDIEGFWGISLGDETLKPHEESVVVRQLALGAFVWVSR